MKKILVLSDLHLRPQIKVQNKTLEGDCIIAIQSIERYVEQLQPDYCIIAGDIFHQTKVSCDELELFKLLFNVLIKAIPREHILTIQGNHDTGRTSISELFGCTDLNSALVAIEDLPVVGKKFCSVEEYRGFFEKEKAEGRKDTMYVIHAPCKPFSNFSLVVLNPDDIPVNSFVICGDTHKSELYEGKEKYILSPGCLYPGNKEELLRNNSTGAWLVEVDGKAIVSATELSLYRRSAADLSCISQDKLEKAVSTFLAKCKDSKLPPVVFLAKDAELKPLEDTYIEIRVPSRVELQVASEGAQNANIPIFERVELITNELLGEYQYKKEMAQFILDMTVTDDPGTVINKLVEELHETTNT